MNPIARRLLVGVVVPLASLGLIFGMIYMAHTTGRYYPAVLILSTVFIAMGLDALIFGFSPEADVSDTMLPRTKVFVGVGVVAGLALYGMVEKGVL